MAEDGEAETRGGGGGWGGGGQRRERERGVSAFRFLQQEKIGKKLMLRPSPHCCGYSYRKELVESGVYLRSR